MHLSNIVTICITVALSFGLGVLWHTTRCKRILKNHAIFLVNPQETLPRPEEIRGRPRLNTQWLMPAPLGRVPRNTAFARTYAIRGQYVIVYDDDGQAWVGPVLSEVAYHLANFGYKKANHWVPLRGKGEKFAGDPLTVEGFTFETYPDWIGRRSEFEELQFWALLEKLRARRFSDGRSAEDFRSVTLAWFE